MRISNWQRVRNEVTQWVSNWQHVLSDRTRDRTADQQVQRVGEIVISVVMGLVIQQAAYGFAIGLNKWMGPECCDWGRRAATLLLLLLTGLGVDFLLWTIPLSKYFSTWNIFLHFGSATLTLLLVSVLTPNDLSLSRGAYVVVGATGFMIALIYYRNFACRMPWLQDELKHLKRWVNRWLMILSGILLIGSVLLWWRFTTHPEQYLGRLLFAVVVVAAPGLIAYVLIGWPILLRSAGPQHVTQGN